MTSKLTKEDISKWLLDDGRGINLIGEYLGAMTKTTFECPNSHPFDMAPNGIKKGRGCPICANKRRAALQSTTTEEFREWLSVNGRGITMLGECTNNHTKTKFRCQHGHEWETIPSSIKRGCGCPSCTGHYIQTEDEFRQWLLEDGRGITLVSKFTTTRVKTSFQCQCGHQWRATPNSIKMGTGCPSCVTYGFKTDKPAWEYAFTRNGYIKCGITNDLTRRLNEHRKHGEIVLVHERYHEIGQLALDWENNIKRTHGGRHVTKEECPDGYTETFPFHLLETIIK